MGRTPIGVRLLALLAILLLLVALPAAALLWMTAVPGRSHSGPLPPLMPAEARLAADLRRHVAAVASEPHNVGYPEALERSARYIEETLAGLGYRVRRQPFAAAGRPVRNIEVVVEPAAPAAQTLVVGAHYDSCCDAPGANDNGTGTAAVIELARSLADLGGKSSLRIRLVLFVNEEPPFFKTDLMGSLVYARRLKQTGEPVLGMISLETLGYYSEAERSQNYPPPLGLIYPHKGNFVAFVGLTSSRAFVRKAVGSFRATPRSRASAGPRPGLCRASTGPIIGRSSRSASRR